MLHFRRWISRSDLESDMANLNFLLWEFKEKRKAFIILLIIFEVQPHIFSWVWYCYNLEKAWVSLSLVRLQLHIIELSQNSSNFDFIEISSTSKICVNKILSKWYCRFWVAISQSRTRGEVFNVSNKYAYLNTDIINPN